jgi:hypothetical protein
MAMKVLTTRFVEAAKPKRNSTGDVVRAEYPDAACPGLHLVVQPSDTRSFAFRYRRRADRKSVKLTIGKAGKGGLSLAAARHAAAAIRHRLEQGVPPVTAVTAVTGESGWGEDRDGGSRIPRAPCSPQEPRLHRTGHRGHPQRHRPASLARPHDRQHSSARRHRAGRERRRQGSRLSRQSDARRPLQAVQVVGRA